MNNFSLKTVLEIIFKVTKKNARILAQSYLLKDESTISKWKKNKLLPRNDDIAKIVEFVMNESKTAQRKIIRDKIEELINEAPIEDELTNIILNTEDFSEFLYEAISVCVAVNENGFKLNCVENDRPLKDSSLKGQVKNNEKYSGTLEFDLHVPEGCSTKSKDWLERSVIEFKGRVNLSPQNKMVSVAKYVRKKAVLGMMLVVVAFGFIIPGYNSMQKNNMQLLASKTHEISKQTSTPVQTSVNTPVQASKPVPSPTQKPEFTSIPTAIPTVKPADKNREGQAKSRTNIKNETKVNSQTTIKQNDGPLTINGDQNIMIQGDKNSITIIKE